MRGSLCHLGGGEAFSSRTQNAQTMEEKVDKLNHGKMKAKLKTKLLMEKKNLHKQSLKKKRQMGDSICNLKDKG